jgi:hypothetical protein
VPVFKSPGLRISKASWRGGRVRASGRIAKSAQFGVKVSFKCGKRTRSKTVRDKRGVWRASIRARCGNRKRGRLTAAYGGDGQFVAQSKSRRVRR